MTGNVTPPSSAPSNSPERGELIALAERCAKYDFDSIEMIECKWELWDQILAALSIPPAGVIQHSDRVQDRGDVRSVQLPGCGAPSAPAGDALEMLALADEIEESYSDNRVVDILLNKAERQLIVAALRSTPDASRIHELEGARTAPSDGAREAWAPEQYWEYADGLLGTLVRDQMRDMLTDRGLMIAPSSVASAQCNSEAGK